MAGEIPVRSFAPPAELVRRTPQSATARELKRQLNSKSWRFLRLVQLREFPWCAECLARGEYTTASQVHHVIDRRERPDLALDADNLESLCHSCHSAETARRMGAFRGRD